MIERLSTIEPPGSSRKPASNQKNHTENTKLRARPVFSVSLGPDQNGWSINQLGKLKLEGILALRSAGNPYTKVIQPPSKILY